MVFALYYNNKLQYKYACKDISAFKVAVYNKREQLFKTVNYRDICGNFNKLFNKRFEKLVDGWEIRTYTNYRKVLNTVQSNKIQTRRRKLNTFNYFYVFDIEATNYKNKYAFSYLYGIKKYNYDYNLNDDNINEYAGEYHAFYTKNAIQKLTDFLKEINKEAENVNQLIYIYVHNLNYDLFELIQNIFPRFELSETDAANCTNDSIFRGSAVKPLRFRFKNLVFIDSLALTNKSLVKISDGHKIKKLIENKTYKEQYFFGSKLPKEELLYNEHDLDVTALGVMDSVRSLKKEFKTFNDYVKSNVSTVTGISKFLNKNIYSNTEDNKRNINKHIARASHNLPLDKDLKIDKERLLFRQKTFQGGFTHANPFIAYNSIFSNLYMYVSKDKKSHYPATMTMRFFPYDFKVIKENLTDTLKFYVTENLKYIQFQSYRYFKSNMLNYRNKVQNGKIYGSYFNPCKYHFICECELRNVQIKFYNNNCMPLIAMSKTNYKGSDYFKKNIIVDNGKLIKADKVTIKATEYDLLSYSLMYEFEITKCNYLEATKKSKWADEYIQTTMRYHLVKKNELSLLKAGNKKIENLVDFTGARLYSPAAVENFYSFDLKDQKSFIKSEYAGTKQNGVNNQYGILVQKIINDNITFDLDAYRYQKEEDVIQGCNGIQTTRDYITGMYITAFARLDLAFMSYIIYNEAETATICYWDTDSIKLKIKKEEREIIEKLFNYYNRKIKKIRDTAVSYYGELYNLGIWEADGDYKYFYTLGAKKYLTVDFNDNVELTNAGVNKRKMSDFLTAKYNELLKKESDLQAFTDLVNKYYHPNVILCSEVSGRKTIKYPDIKGDIIKLSALDENGDIIKIAQRPTALITECDYNLSNTRGKSLINRQHYQLCRRLQLNAGYDFNCNIKSNIVGTATGIITDDRSDFII